MKLTIKNYKEVTKKVDFSSLPEAAQEAHKEFDSFADFYNEDKDIKEMIDNHFKIVEPYIKDTQKKSTGSKKTETTKSRTKKTSTKTSTRNTTTKSKSTSKKATRKPNEVDLMPLEVKIIRRYINMYGKKVTERQVSLLYKVIQKAATEKTIRKTSKYAAEIKRIGNDLICTYKEMDGTCTFEVPQDLYNKLKEIVDSYGVTPAVALIKRFINLYGNITKEKAQRLLTSVTNSLKNGKVSKSEKEYEQIKNVQRHLNEYLESDKLLVTNVQLRGLKGLAGLGK
jgi:hypothetical protein